MEIEQAAFLAENIILHNDYSYINGCKKAGDSV